MRAIVGLKYVGLLKCVRTLDVLTFNTANYSTGLLIMHTERTTNWQREAVASKGSISRVEQAVVVSQMIVSIVLYVRLFRCHEKDNGASQACFLLLRTC